MKANFHLITESEEEILACTKFIEDILLKRKAILAAKVEPPPPMKWNPPKASDIEKRVDAKAKELGWSDHDDDADDVAVLSIRRPNVSPGEPSIVKIGAATAGYITQQLEAGFQLDHKYGEHAKLLWKRGMIKFDGSDYYVDYK